jgi:hypothetical protein
MEKKWNLKKREKEREKGQCFKALLKSQGVVGAACVHAPLISGLFLLHRFVAS